MREMFEAPEDSKARTVQEGQNDMEIDAENAERSGRHGRGSSSAGSTVRGDRESFSSTASFPHIRPTSPIATPFTFPAAPSSKSKPRTTSTAILNSNDDSRHPPTPYSPSSNGSPPTSSPFRSPVATPVKGRASFLPMPAGSNPAASPWHMLAASSGAPTPSLDGPGGGSVRGSSPHLGYPFEQLNIGGSWSGANLWGDGRTPEPPAEPVPAPEYAMTGNGTLGGGQGGMSNETMARYRAMAGKPAKDDANPSVGGGGAALGGFKMALPAGLAKRRGSLPKASSAGTLNPPMLPPTLTKLSSPLSSQPVTAPTSSPGSSRLEPISSSDLSPLLSRPATLILDVRPPSAFHPLHLPSSHSLPMPSTLLRRPAFDLAKLVQMLTPLSMEAVSNWKAMDDIVLVDQDSGSAGNGSVLKGLAGKFEREGFEGKLWFVKGGVSAIKREGKCRLVADSDSDGENGDSQDPVSNNDKGVIGKGLGKLAFQKGMSLQLYVADHATESTGSKRQVRQPGPSTPGSTVPHSLTSPGNTFKLNPFDTKSQPLATSIEGVAGSSSFASSFSKRQAPKLEPANPFFDNIRQNLELSHGGITERISLGLNNETLRRAKELPPWLADLVTMDDKDSMDKLAHQFYEIELGEQKRLQAVMEWHTKGSGAVIRPEESSEKGRQREFMKARDVQEVRRLTGDKETEDESNPFSITAGVERGTKNRYKNIWPYDFSRVKLSSPADDDSDYINASFIQPRGTARRYIATQGPLDTTYKDFWTLVWEQDVRVIVMLTKQLEGGLIKCGNYWTDAAYGKLRLSLLAQTGGEDVVQQGASGFDFGVASPASPANGPSDVTNIKRVFRLSHDDQPSQPPRKITQIQCTSWPDFDVPESPDTLLALIKDVDAAVEETYAEDGEVSEDKRPPVLVHCSAGVGRTGSFIIVDAVLDGLRRERRSQSMSPPPPSVDRQSSSSTESFSSNHSKSVSFLSPTIRQTRSGSEPNIFSVSPAAMETPMPNTVNPFATSFMDAKSPLEEKMEVDHPGQSAPALQFDRYRGDSEDSDWARRPSITSVFSSSERASEDSPEHEVQVLFWRTHKGLPAHTGSSPGPIVRPITQSNQRHRTPSPISQMEDPIAAVLEGMRVQRMSLVQSLRQYLFIHRAIIHHYLSMIDDDPSLASDSEMPSRASTAPISTSTSASSAHNTDDESHIKRRASPTELTPDDDDAVRIGSSLSKRASFKKMRSSGIDGILSPPGSGSSIGSSGSPGRLRRRDKH
ncbi:tyrosine-protein phosphatase 2/3, partial [Tremellales sp. Uapishka_1]